MNVSGPRTSGTKMIATIWLFLSFRPWKLWQRRRKQTLNQLLPRPTVTAYRNLPLVVTKRYVI